MSLQEEARRRAKALRAQHQLSCYDNDDNDVSDDDNDALFAAANALATPSSSVAPTAPCFASEQSHQSAYYHRHDDSHRVHHQQHHYQQHQQYSHHSYHQGSHSNNHSLKLSATKSTSPASSPESVSTATTASSLYLNYHPPSTTMDYTPSFSLRHNTSSPPPHSHGKNNNNNNNMATQARRDWQQHGTGISQALEDVRLHYRTDLPRVRVFASAAKVDAAGQDYTAYLIRVEDADGSSSNRQQQDQDDDATIIEHRFSDFYKLQQELDGAAVDIGVPFPSRLTWAGRLGNWTPAQVWAPTQHQSLIQYRLKQLDAWLVHVVQVTPQLPPVLQREVYQFLQARVSVPCQQPLRVAASTSESFSNWINPVTFTMGSALRQACRSVETLCHLPSSSSEHPNKQQALLPASSSLGTMPEADHTIPLDLLRVARGILFVTVVKAGWVVSGRMGTGLLVQRLNGPDQAVAEWSAPTAIGTFGVGWGILAGADVTHYMVIFTSDSAVRDLVQQSTTVQVGAELSAAMGPLGRSANSHLQSGDWTLHTAYAYAHSQGLFVGVSLEGSLWQVRHDVNAKFYGQRNIEAIHLLHQSGPTAAQPLYDRLALALSQQHQLAASSSWLPSPPPRPTAASTV